MEADLLILDGSPLEEIDNITKIWRVVRAGTVHDPKVLLP
jgi:imidazolonepropionase-like amidohydrolase